MSFIAMFLHEGLLFLHEALQRLGELAVPFRQGAARNPSRFGAIDGSQ
jgi:hypothetical protein